MVDSTHVNRRVVEVERRGPEVDVELGGARGPARHPLAEFRRRQSPTAAMPASASATTWLHRGGDVHHDAGFVGCERFQRGELRFQQRRAA